jgi:hypothetical protein
MSLPEGLPWTPHYYYAVDRSGDTTRRHLETRWQNGVYFDLEPLTEYFGRARIELGNFLQGSKPGDPIFEGARARIEAQKLYALGLYGDKKATYQQSLIRNDFIRARAESDMGRRAYGESAFLLSEVFKAYERAARLTMPRSVDNYDASVLFMAASMSEIDLLAIDVAEKMGETSRKETGQPLSNEGIYRKCNDLLHGPGYNDIEAVPFKNGYKITQSFRRNIPRFGVAHSDGTYLYHMASIKASSLYFSDTQDVQNAIARIHPTMQLPDEPEAIRISVKTRFLNIED